MSGSCTYYCYGPVNGDTKYNSNKNGKYLNQIVEEHLKFFGVHFAMAEVSRNLKNFKKSFGLQNIFYGGLSPDRLILVNVFFRQKKLFLIYDSDTVTVM